MNRNISNKPSSFTWLLPKILKAPVSDRSAPHSAEVEIAQLQGLLDVFEICVTFDKVSSSDRVILASEFNY